MITLVALPPYSPELNPVERVWLCLKERFLSHRLHDDYDAIVDAACKAWRRLTAQAGRIRSLLHLPLDPEGQDLESMVSFEIGKRTRPPRARSGYQQCVAIGRKQT
jgi:DDE superfamily endonuclease